MARLPLRAELFLLGHDADNNGEPFINVQTLEVGLAGAVLLELWLSKRIAIGWTFDVMRQQWHPDPGRISLMDDDPIGDPLGDAAVAAIRHTRYTPQGHDQIRAWLRTFAGNDLYERVRADMLVAGVLRRTSRRRFGMVKTDMYTAATTTWAIRIRAQIRSAVHGVEHPNQYGREIPDGQRAALCGLASVMELAEFVYLSDLPARRLQRLLGHIAEQHHPTIRDVITAVDAGRGDLAVAAMR